MSTPRAVTLFCCLAALPLIGCAPGAGVGPQAQVSSAPAVVAAYSPGPGGAPVYAAGPGAPAAILVMLPGPGDGLTADPALWAAQGFDVVTPPPAEIYRLAANRDAALERLIASVQTMAAAPIWLVGPNPAVEAAMAGIPMAGIPMAGPGNVSGVVLTSVASNAGTCSERMIYSYSDNGAGPKVSVSKSGDACPAGSPFGAASSPAIMPHAPAVQPNAPRLIQASAVGVGGSPAARKAAVQRVAELIKEPAS